MMETTILFADDQIPDDQIADEDIQAIISQRYPGAQKGFITAFAKMRGIVKALRDRNYSVTVANTYAMAMELADDRHFDVAIIDLGWFGDHSLERSARGAAGWDISNQIERADKKLSPRHPTARIIYSSRFAKNPEISEKASKEGILPFFKVYNEQDSYPMTTEDKPTALQRSSANRDAVNRSSLAAAVGFVEHLIHARTTEMDAALKILGDAEASERRWELITISCIVVSVALVAVSIVSVVIFSKPVTIVTAIAGAITAMIPRLFFAQLKASRREINEAMDRVVKLAPRSSSS
jgi:hypothetical protein